MGRPPLEVNSMIRYVMKAMMNDSVHVGLTSGFHVFRTQDALPDGESGLNFYFFFFLFLCFLLDMVDLHQLQATPVGHVFNI